MSLFGVDRNMLTSRSGERRGREKKGERVRRGEGMKR